MTRLIGGSAGGLRLATPSGAATRPTSERVREAVFSRLDHYDAVAGARVLDLYAGSGALGLEAASRGAAHVVLVESDRATAQLITRNIASTKLHQAVARAMPVERFVAAGLGAAGGAPYGLVLIDPPYAVTEVALAQVLAALCDGGWLADDALVVVERSTRSPEPTWPAGLVRLDDKKYGETTVWFAEPPAASSQT